jgi:hypothetical protein
MKVKFSLLSFFMFAFTVMSINAQIIGDDAFMKSDFIQMGINKGGVYVSQGVAPEDYVNNDYVIHVPIIDSTTIDTITYTYDYEWWSYYDSCACWVIDSITTESYTYVTWSYLIDSSTIDTITYEYPYDWWSYYDSCACWVIDSTTIESYTYVYFDYIYTFDTIESAIGIVYDADMDGWDVGDPTEYWGDVTLPGSPEEGFGIEIDGNSYYNASQYLYPNDVPGAITSWDDSGDSTKTVWEGDVAGVHITQETVIPDGALYILTRISLENTTATDLADVYYLRNFDPDQEQPWSWDFITDNIVHYNFPTDTQALVSAEGNSMGGNFAMYGSRDYRSRVSYGAFYTSDANPVSDAWNSITPFSASGETEGDIALQVSFKIDLIPAGESTSFAFVYIFSNDEAIIDEAMEPTKYVPVLPEECIAGTDVTSSDITTTTATVAWTPGSAGVEYLVEWRKVGVPTWTSAITTDPSLLLTGLDICTYYQYRVTTLCGDETPSPLGSFKTECVTDIDASNAITSAVYPNPNTGSFTLTVSLPAAADAVVSIADAVGRVVYENNLQAVTVFTETMNLLSMPSGIYTVKVMSGENTSVTNFVIEK